MDKQIVQLYHALKESSFTVAITGAGISIAAGGVTMNGMMKNFRSSGMFSGDPDKMYEAFEQSFCELPPLTTSLLKWGLPVF